MNKIIIDLDNTLYPEGKGIFHQVNERINLYLVDQMGFPREEINSIRVDYMKRYGTTLRGLMVHHNVEPDKYLEFVHDVEIESVLSGDGPLERFLTRLKGDKVLFTNGSCNYAIRILNALGITHHFKLIFDIVSMDYIAKPDVYGYKKLLSLFENHETHDYLFIDDRSENIITARNLGMITAHITTDGKKECRDAHYAVKRITDLEEKLKDTVFF